MSVSRFQSAGLNGVMYLRWDAYPLKRLPVSIDVEILVSLRLRHSKSEQLGDDAQVYFNIFNACLQTIDAFIESFWCGCPHKISCGCLLPRVTHLDF